MSLTSFANDGKDMSDYKPMDMKQFEGVKIPQSGSPGKHSGFLNITCKTAEGIDLPSSSPDFAHCMRQKANKMK
jgi:hypothetical protein